MKRYKKFLKFRTIIIPLALIALVLEGINIFLTNQVSSESVTVSRLESEIGEIEQKNFTLKSDVLEYSSLERVASRAAEMGLVETKKTISLYEPVTVAVR
jgi:cell division protein FtsL